MFLPDSFDADESDLWQFGEGVGVLSEQDKESFLFGVLPLY